MIDPQEQWCIQIDVTNVCPRQCSNCTRLTAHHCERFTMDPEYFAQAVAVLADFPTTSPPTVIAKHKVVGIIGGEPLWHPQFAALAKMMRELIPNRENRGLWTGLMWQHNRHEETIREVFGFVNNNLHTTECLHSPVLVAIEEVVTDRQQMWDLISDCWLQRLWSGTITPKGFFFCEVAGAMDMLFDGPGGLPVEEGCWRRPLEDFRGQIERWCPRCGVPLNLKGRRDREEIDDISQGNLNLLPMSPRVLAGQYTIFDPRGQHETVEQPWRYLQ